MAYALKAALLAVFALGLAACGQPEPEPMPEPAPVEIEPEPMFKGKG